MQKKSSFIAIAAFLFVFPQFDILRAQPGKNNGHKQEHFNKKENHQDKDQEKDKKDKNIKLEAKEKIKMGHHNDEEYSPNGSHSDHGMMAGYSWDKFSFRDRLKIKNSKSVWVCHRFNGKGPDILLRVNEHALQAHLNHGDVIGKCPEVKNVKYSPVYIKKRTDYYNTLQKSEEELMYSKSMLLYAKARLAASQQRLAQLRSQRVATAEIDRKQAVVVQLDQNVSLLESLVGITANLLVNKM